MQQAITPVAANLQQSRRARGLSISALAGAAGISKSTLSELERGRGNPSLDTLWALAHALTVPLSTLFDDSSRADARTLRLRDAEVIAAEGGLVTQHLLSLHGRGEIELCVLSLEDDAERRSAGHGLGQYEHVVCLSGLADVGLDESPTLLEPGDLVTFPAERPHHYRAVDGPARLIALHDYPR